MNQIEIAMVDQQPGGRFPGDLEMDGPQRVGVYVLDPEQCSAQSADNSSDQRIDNSGLYVLDPQSWEDEHQNMEHKQDADNKEADVNKQDMR